MTNSLDLNVAPASIEKILSMLGNTDERTVYSLLDAAQYPEFHYKKLPHGKHTELISLLGEAAQENATFAGPILLIHKRLAECRTLKWLSEALNQYSFASLMSSSQPLIALTSHLTWLTDVQHDDGTEWVMRYYDPRILPHWLEVLTPEQKSLALHAIHRWIYLDVRGQWQIIEGEDKAIPATPEHPMRLSAQQHEQLMQKCLPYMLMGMLNDDDPSLLESIAKYQRYDYLNEQSLKARSHHLDSMMDIKTYCMLALMLGTDFDLRTEAKLALAAPLSPSAFSQRILAWTPAQWDAISKEHP